MISAARFTVRRAARSFSPSLRKTLFRSQPLQRYTPHTLTSAEQIEDAVARIRKTVVGTDNGEFMEGMAAAAGVAVG
jgi:DNA-binding IclR family transcriptional regulator